MKAPANALSGLKQQRPEWQPWLAVVEEILREAADPAWAAAVPGGVEVRDSRVPLLEGVSLTLKAASVRRLFERLIRVASQGRTAKMANLHAAMSADLDVVTLFGAALRQDSDRVRELAAVSGVDAEALQAIVMLLPVPLLHACNRRWASAMSGSWVEGYCPVCASWPAFAEMRGIERNRYFRCGRCGGEWHARPLHCGFCGMSDHAELVTLVPEKGDSHAVIDACRRCLGYVKTFTRLQGCAPEMVMLEDLATVDLDVAAIEHGYARKPGGGYAIEAAISSTAGPARFFTWKA